MKTEEEKIGNLSAACNAWCGLVAAESALENARTAAGSAVTNDVIAAITAYYNAKSALDEENARVESECRSAENVIGKKYNWASLPGVGSWRSRSVELFTRSIDPSAVKCLENRGSMIICTAPDDFPEVTPVSSDVIAAYETAKSNVIALISGVDNALKVFVEAKGKRDFAETQVAELWKILHG